MERLPFSVLFKMNDRRLLAYYKSIREQVRMKYRDLIYYSCGEIEHHEEYNDENNYVEYIKSLLSRRGHVNRPVKRRKKCR